MKVVLAGEGDHDLGGWAGDPVHRDRKKRGVLLALLQRVRADGWEIIDATEWKRLPKYQAGEHRSREKRMVLELVRRWRHRCDVLVFSRDVDKDPARAQEIVGAVQEAKSLFPDAPLLVGGPAVKRLESWLLALAGYPKTEDLSDQKADAAIAARGLGHVDAMVEHVDRADLTKIPLDAHSLRHWLELAQHAAASRR